MKERSIKEIEDEIDATVPTGNVGKVMDLVDEHGNTFDKMFHAVIDGNLARIQELEALGIDITDRSFLHAAIKNDKQLVVFYQVKKGANLDTIVELAKEHENNFILQWAKFARRNKMGK